MLANNFFLCFFSVIIFLERVDECYGLSKVLSGAFHLSACISRIVLHKIVYEIC